MPSRNIIFSNGQIYHVYNRALDGRNIFKDNRILTHAEMELWYYRFSHLPIPLSKYLTLKNELKISYHNSVANSPTLVKVYCYCFMSNHFHLLLEQVEENGISKFLSNFQNSFTRYQNLKQDRLGPIFQSSFKAVRIETEEQLLHVSRYIHLNPHTGYLVKNLESLRNYIWSSLPDYLGTSDRIHKIAETKMILDLFKNKQDYFKFVSDNANYQRELDQIKHLTFDYDS
jgi:putative transposase